jgi:hypothetical protein
MKRRQTIFGWNVNFDKKIRTRKMETDETALDEKRILWAVGGKRFIELSG